AQPIATADDGSTPAPTVTATARHADGIATGAATPTAANGPWVPVWDADAEKELGKIPFFVRGKARRNTERFAQERALAAITVETLYDAKAHFGR
ncbi:MAG: ferredoxin:protochlorophyllide reductase (ATP-dependent) subunit B, partial [Burkholderiales bacterium]